MIERAYPVIVVLLAVVGFSLIAISIPDDDLHDLLFGMFCAWMSLHLNERWGAVP